jgi:hypothetical protein
LGCGKPQPLAFTNPKGSRWAGFTNAKAISYAESNVQASLDYAQSLLRAKDLTEMMRLHGDYVQAQMRSLAEQASELGQAVSRAAMDAAKPKN